jgi:hypothetical protein
MIVDKSFFPVLFCSKKYSSVLDVIQTSIKTDDGNSPKCSISLQASWNCVAGILIIKRNIRSVTKRHLFCFVYLKSYDTPTHIWRDRVSYISIRVFVIIKNDEKDFNALPETVFSIRLSLSLHILPGTLLSLQIVFLHNMYNLLCSCSICKQRNNRRWWWNKRRTNFERKQK